jgi:HK97 family phage portal protein
MAANFMSGMDRALALFGLEPKAEIVRKTKPGQLVPWWEQMGQMAAYGDGVPEPFTYARQAEYYRRAPSMYAAVSLLAEAAAMTEMAVFAGSEKDAERIYNHPVLDLLRRPAPNMEWLSLDKFTVIESIVSSLRLAGNTYLYMGGRSSPKRPPTMLLPLRPDRITPVGSNTDGVVYYLYAVGGKEFPILTEDVIHLRTFNPLNDFAGLSPIEPASYALSADVAAQRHNLATFKNSARISGVVESDKETVKPDQKEMMERYWQDTYTGNPDKAGQLAFLWDGFKFKDLGMNLRDAEYIQGRKMNRQDSFLTQRVHPALLMAEDVNRANAQTGEYLFAKYTLLPMLTRLIARLNAELMTLYDAPAELRCLNVVPRDVAQEVAERESNLRTSVVTPNEVRSAIGFDNAPWGDVPVAYIEKVITVNEMRKFAKLEPLEDGGDKLLAEVGKSGAPSSSTDDDQNAPIVAPQELFGAAAGTVAGTDDRDDNANVNANDAQSDAQREPPKKLWDLVGATSPQEMDAIFMAAARTLGGGY